MKKKLPIALVAALALIAIRQTASDTIMNTL